MLYVGIVVLFSRWGNWYSREIVTSPKLCKVEIIFLVNSTYFYSFVTFPTQKLEIFHEKSCYRNSLHNSLCFPSFIWHHFMNTDNLTSIITNGCTAVCDMTFFHPFNKYLLSSEHEPDTILHSDYCTKWATFLPCLH